MPKFARETLSPALISELAPLLEKHWREVAHYQDIPLEPDWNTYQALDEKDVLRLYTSRCTDTDALIGYALFIVSTNVHYKSSVQAKQDVIFIDPTRRGFGARFIIWCDNQLKNEGVEFVFHHTKAARDFGPMLERMGYERIDYIYGKRLQEVRS